MRSIFTILFISFFVMNCQASFDNVEEQPTQEASGDAVSSQSSDASGESSGQKVRPLSDDVLAKNSEANQDETSFDGNAITDPEKQVPNEESTETGDDSSEENMEDSEDDSSSDENSSPEEPQPPADSPFQVCSGSEKIEVQLYSIEPGTKKVPDFESITKVDDFCMNNYSVSKRRFDQGFPGHPELIEWFAIDSQSAIYIQEAGQYRFKLRSDDGALLDVNDELLIDNDGVHAVRDKTGRIHLDVGYHKIRVRYFQGPRYHIALELFWKRPGDRKYEIIPADSFRSLQEMEAQ